MMPLWMRHIFGRSFAAARGHQAPAVEATRLKPATWPCEPAGGPEEPVLLTPPWPKVPEATVLRDRLAAVVLFSSYPSDPRPRRAAEALAREGMKVEIVCLRLDPGEPSRERVGGV